jgi:hypothetical protein
LSDLREVWEEHGKTVLTKLAVADPAKLAQIAYGLLPRDIFAEQMALLRGILDVIDAAGVVGSPEEILAGIEQDLRARHARQIEHVGSKAVAIPLPRSAKSESDQSDNDNG